MGGVRFKRGSKVNLPRLLEGEPAICLDTKQVYVGSSSENVELETAGKAAAVQANLNAHNTSTTPHANMGWAKKSEVYSKEDELSALTKELYKLPNTATPDDAFFSAYIGAGKYAFKLTVLLPNGTPADNVLVNGLSAPLGGAVRTDANGKCLGVASSSSVTISIPFTEIIGIASFSKTVSATYAVTNLTLTASVDQTKAKTITTSGTYRMYNGISTFDAALIGAGGGGREKGGNGGDILNAYNRTVVSTLQIVIGAAGVGGINDPDSSQVSAATDGGDTKITNLSVTALGGKASGVIIGNGGVGGNPGDDGTNRSEYPFGDSSIPCSGGGGGGNQTGSVWGLPLNKPAGKAGLSYGGENGSNGKGIGGGGGGGWNVSYSSQGQPSSNRYGRGGNGYQGAIMLRWRYK